MAITLGTTSENLLRGIDRLVVAVAGVIPARQSRRVPAIPRAWGAQRGTGIVQAQIDIAGGFPGSLRWQQQLQNTSLHLTDLWLIVGEGTPSGFAIPIDKISGVAIQSDGGLQPPNMVVWYRDADQIGSFCISVRGTARNRTGAFRAEWLCDHLLAAGVPAIDDELAQFVPPIHVAWDDVADFTDDTLLFTGEGIASAGGLFGSTLDSATIWLTEHALIWCPDHGLGVNVLKLDAIIDCRSGFGDRLSIGIEDACGGRYDLYFDFSNQNERSNIAAEVKHLLAAAGIPTGTSVMPIAPWRSGGTRRPSEM